MVPSHPSHPGREEGGALSPKGKKRKNRVEIMKFAEQCGLKLIQ